MHGGKGSLALSEFELKRCRKLMDAFLEKRRPPVHIRSQLDIAYRIINQSIEIFEIRPVWNDPSRTMEQPVAKTTYVKTQHCWKIYWMRADLKWHGYEPLPQVKHLEEFLEEVNNDPFACFRG